MPKKDVKLTEKDTAVESLMDQLVTLKKDIASQEKLREDLQREVYRLQMERDILEVTSVVIKKTGR